MQTYVGLCHRELHNSCALWRKFVACQHLDKMDQSLQWVQEAEIHLHSPVFTISFDVNLHNLYRKVHRPALVYKHTCFLSSWYPAVSLKLKTRTVTSKVDVQHTSHEFVGNERLRTTHRKQRFCYVPLTHLVGLRVRSVMALCHTQGVCNSTYLLCTSDSFFIK